MSGDSEEKTLPPTEHKLRKVREKGQVASSDDFVSGVSVTLGMMYIIFNWRSFFDVAARLFDLSVVSIATSAPKTGLAVFLTLIIEVGFLIAPLFLLLILAGITTNLLFKKGIPFSLDPIKPDFAKVNPGAGLKKLFSRRNATEFGISFVKISIWFALSALFIWLLLQTLLASLHCSLGCVMESANSLGLLVILSAMIMLVFAGLMDMPLQSFLFRHEQRMGHKELKHELKDIYGAQEFKSRRRQQHQELSSGPGGAGGDQGTGVIKDGSKGMSVIIRGFDSAVGIYFHPEHCDVPRVVYKFTGSAMQDQLRKAEGIGIPLFQDALLARELSRKVDVGQFIGQNQFEKVARILIEVGAIH
ncbi:MAG: EscU/YscU/HrcU family type III secretion system export apparatus switch protein [Pseudomonadota bacterium]